MLSQHTSPTLPPPTLKLYLGRNRGRQQRPLSELVYLESDANYTWLVWRNGERLLMPRTLSHFESRLSADQFVRLSRHYLVNMAHIARIERRSYTQLRVWLHTGKSLDVARRRVLTVHRQLHAFPG
jgi:DNA-binding LytR/AlgR family response regulator